MSNKIMAKAAISSVLALGVLAASTAHAVPEQPTSWEKCAGIAKAGKNDCGALNVSHGCAGQAGLIMMIMNGYMCQRGLVKKLPGA